MKLCPSPRSVLIAILLSGIACSVSAQRASLLDPETLVLEIPSLQVGDEFYRLELIYTGGVTFSIGEVSLIDDDSPPAATFDFATLVLDMPLVAYLDQYFALSLQLDGDNLVATTVLEIAGPSAPTVNGTVTPPEIYTEYTNDKPSGGVASVCMYTMQLVQVGDCIINDSDNYTASQDFSFAGEPGQAYIVSSFFGNQGGFSLITEPLAGDFYQDLDFSAEVEFNLIYATAFAMGRASSEQYFTGFEGELRGWKRDARISLERYRLYQQDRDPVYQADRLTEAVFNLTIDKLNQGKGVEISLLENESVLNAYGAVGSFNRDISSLVDSPITPLNPGFIFGASKSLAGGGEEYNVGFSNMDGEQWDFLALGTSPHLNVGGETIVFTGVEKSVLGTADSFANRIYKQILGASGTNPVTPLGYSCITPRLSPNGSLVAVACIELDNSIPGEAYLQGAYNIYIADMATGEIVTQVTDVKDHDLVSPADLEVLLYGATGPDWSKDGSSIYFGVNAVDLSDPADPQLRASLYEYRLSSEQLEYIWGARRAIISGNVTVTPDDDTLFFSMIYIGGDSTGDTSFNIFRADLTSNEVFYFTQTPDNSEAYPSISFDGRYLFFVDIQAGEETVKLSNRYQFEVEKDFGDFANANNYFTPAMVASEFGLVAAEGLTTDEYGTVISSSDNRTSDSYSGINDHDRVYNETRNTVLQINPSNYSYYTPISW